MDIVDATREGAISFGAHLMNEFINENISMGITQAGKTRTVGLALKDVDFWLRTGALYEALAEVVTLRAAGFDPEDAPFLTDDRVKTFENKIREYLGLELV